jgi:dihydrofolate synthase / folylpolyglutamate synthase
MPFLKQSMAFFSYGFMTEQKKLFAYLSGLQGKGIQLDLATIRRILKKMQDPQDAYPSIIVGGTNGKGSICAMISSILAASGYRVGLYTSPHLIDVRERIRCNGRMISSEEMAGCIVAVKDQDGDALTYFEFLTAMAFLYFCREKVDIAILEVGMGGRLDATNVVQPIASAVSNISLEHRAYLGKRLSQIAAEKGGIIKAGGVCVTAATQKGVLDVLEDICRVQRATLYRIGRDMNVRSQDHGASFAYRGPGKRYDRLPSPLRGRHQIRNAAVAVGLADILSQKAWDIPEGALREGLKRADWPGRLEVLQEAPQVVLDGAHNPAGISALCRALRDDFHYHRLLMIFGVLMDKEFRGMVSRVAAMADMLILTRPPIERALAPAKMAHTASRYCRAVVTVEDPQQAMDMALAAANPEDLICVSGSLYLVGRIKASWNRSAGSFY